MPDPARPSGLGRRKFVRAGLATPVVVSSLASKPVLGAGPPYNCTISGQMSGNTSNHRDTVDCRTLGRSPGYWKNHLSWPSPLVSGQLPAAGQCFSDTAMNAGTRFNGFTVGSAVLATAFRCSGGVVVDASQSGFSSATRKATMRQVINTPGGLNDTIVAALGRATVASLLNSYAFAPNYPLTAVQIIRMFNAVYMGGTYQVNSTTFWNRDQVKSYFESLYGAV